MMLQRREAPMTVNIARARDNKYVCLCLVWWAGFVRHFGQWGTIGMAQHLAKAPAVPDVLASTSRQSHTTSTGTS